MSVPDLGTDTMLDQIRRFVHGTDRQDTDEKIATGTIYHFFEGRKQDKDGHWHGTGYFYWQTVYRDPGTGKRIKKGGKAFASCPDEERKRQFLADTGRVVEPDTGRLQKVQRSPSPLFGKTPASVYEIQG